MSEDLPIELRAAWRSVQTQAGRRFDYQYEGHCPTVRAARYEPARDYIFLLMDRERRLYRIPVRVSEEALALARTRGRSEEGILRLIEQRFSSVLEAGFEPRNNFPYDQLDGWFAIDREAMQQLLTARG